MKSQPTRYSYLNKNKRMECKGCLQRYDGKDRKPLILVECGHSVCQTCIQQACEKVIPQQLNKTDPKLMKNNKRPGSQLKHQDQIEASSLIIDKRSIQSSALNLTSKNSVMKGGDHLQPLAGLCPECQTEFAISRPVDQFPVNQALLSCLASMPLVSLHSRRDTHLIAELDHPQYSVDQIQSIDFEDLTTQKHPSILITENGRCAIHDQDVQAFCEDELRLLCVTCLIQEKDLHKEHQVRSLADAAHLERVKLANAAGQASELSSRTESKILRLKSTVVDLENQANGKRNQTRQLYDTIRQKLLQREAAMLKTISSALENETRTHRCQIMQQERQMRGIRKLYEESSVLLSAISDVEVLAAAPERSQLMYQATQQTELKYHPAKINPLNTDDEIMKVMRALQQMIQGVAKSNPLTQKKATKKKLSIAMPNKHRLLGTLAQTYCMKPQRLLTKTVQSDQQPIMVKAPESQRYLMFKQAISREIPRSGSGVTIGPTSRLFGNYLNAKHQQLSRQTTTRNQGLMGGKTSPIQQFMLREIESPLKRPPEIYSMEASSHKASSEEASGEIEGRFCQTAIEIKTYQADMDPVKVGKDLLSPVTYRSGSSQRNKIGKRPSLKLPPRAAKMNSMMAGKLNMKTAQKLITHSKTLSATNKEQKGIINFNSKVPNSARRAHPTFLNRNTNQVVERAEQQSQKLAQTYMTIDKSSIEHAPAHMTQETFTDLKPFTTQMNNNLLSGLGGSLTIQDSGLIDANPLKIQKSRLLFLNGDTDDVEPGFLSPSPFSRSPVKLEELIQKTNQSAKKRKQMNQQSMFELRMQKSQEQSPIKQELDFTNNTASNSNIFRRKQEFLFVFGGINKAGSPCKSYEVFDLSSGIWREFEGDPDKLGQEPFRVQYALPTTPADKTILLLPALAQQNRTIKSLSIADMRANIENNLQLPAEMHDLVCTVHIGKGKHMLFDSAGQTFLISRQSVEPRNTLPVARLAMCAALSPCGAFIYAIGGLNPSNGDYITTNDRYSIQSDTWHMNISVCDPLVDAVAVTMPDGIYLLGGTIPEQMPGATSKQVLRLETTTGQMHRLNDMQVARSAFTACSSGNCEYIYAAGGLTENGQASAIVERYNVQTGAWDLVSPLTSARNSAAMCLATVFTD